MDPTTRRVGKMVDTFCFVFLALTMAAIGASLPVDDTSKCHELNGSDAPMDLPRDGTVYVKASRGGDANAILNMHKMVDSRHSTTDDNTSLCNATLTAEDMTGDWERVMFSVKQMAYPPTQAPSQSVSSTETSPAGTYDDDSGADERTVSPIPSEGSHEEGPDENMTVIVIVAGDMVEVCMEPKGSSNDERLNEKDYVLRVQASVNITWCFCREGASPRENEGQQTTIPDEQPTQTTLQGGNTTDNIAHDESWKYLTIVLILVLIFALGGFCVVKLYRQMRKNLGKEETLVTYSTEIEETNKNPRTMSLLTTSENCHQSRESRPTISTGMDIARNSRVPSASPDLKIPPSTPPLTLPPSPPPPPRPSYIPPPPQLEIIQANNDDNHYDDENDYDYIDLNVFKEQMEKERLEREGKAKLMMKEIEIMNLDRYDSENSLYEEFKSKENEMNKYEKPHTENRKAGYGNHFRNGKPRPNVPGYKSDQDDDGYEKINFKNEPKQGDEKRMQNCGNTLNDDENIDKGERAVPGDCEDGQGKKSSDEDELEDGESSDKNEKDDESSDDEQYNKSIDEDKQDDESSDEDEQYNKNSDEDEQQDDDGSDEDEQYNKSSDEDEQQDDENSDDEQYNKSSDEDERNNKSNDTDDQ